MTASGLATLFSRINYLWGDPVGKDENVAREWYKALSPIDDDVVLEALPILAQQVDRRPSIAQIIAQSKVIAAGRPTPPQLPEARIRTAYTEVWMRLMRAWREDRLDAKLMQPLAVKHAAYFQQGNSRATEGMVEESQALLQQVRPARVDSGE